MATKIKKFSGSLPDQENEIKSLEAYLFDALEPVKPRQEFVQGLRGRLEKAVFPQPYKQNLVQVRATRKSGSQSIFLFLAGLVASLILLVTGIKATLSIVEAIKSIRQGNHHSDNNISRNHSASLIKSASTGS